MSHPSITADFLITAVDAVERAFADSLLTETEATMVIVYRRDRPGGHRNDAYPFDLPHQPSSYERVRIVVGSYNGGYR